MAVITNPSRRWASPGQILHIRNGAVLQNYGDNRISQADYGNGILAAIAAANQAGDIIDIGPMRAALVNATVTTAGVRIQGHETEIVRSGNYTHMLRISGNDVEVRGLRLLGQGTANTGTGFGIYITGNRAIVDGCEVSGQRGTTATNGDGTCIRIDGDDVTITNYVSRDAGYSSLSCHDSHRLVVDGATLIDQNHRAIAVSGVGANPWIELKNIRSVAQTAGKFAYMNIHFSPGGSLGELRMTNVTLEEGDKYGSGVSFNDADGHNMIKIENTSRMILDNVQLLHGTNAGAGAVRSLYLQADGTNGPVDTLILKNCTIADAITANMKTNYLYADNTWFGWKQIGDHNELWYRLYASHAIFRNCTFNQWDKSKCFATYSTATNADAANDFYEFYGNRFLANAGGDVHVFANGTGSGNGPFHFPGRVIFDKTNTMENFGAGSLFRSSNDVEELILTTDANGDMLYDGSTGRHPVPGAGPSFFPTMDPGSIGTYVDPPDGTKIWNTAYDPDAVADSDPLRVMKKGWIFNGGTWKQIP